VIHGAAPDAVRLDGTEVRATDGRFVLPNAGSGFKAEFGIG
jgi:hypothetical protein